MSANAANFGPPTDMIMHYRQTNIFTVNILVSIVAQKPSGKNAEQQFLVKCYTPIDTDVSK